MFAKLKKMLFIVPIMIFGLFLCTGTNVFAGDAVLTNAESSVVVGKKDKENTYYFSNNAIWEFKAQVNLIKDWDTDLKYRVIRPDGSATDWSEKVRYADTNGTFSIDYGKLTYNKTVDMTEYKSVAPANTYFVDIEYYGQLIWSWHQKDKDETLKIVINSTVGSENIPSINIERSENTFKVKSSIINGEGKGKSIVTSVEYFFSKTELDITTEDGFYTNMVASELKGVAPLEAGASVETEFTVESVGDYNYVYVMTKTGNGYVNIGRLNLTTGDVEQDTPDTDGVGSGGGDSGLFDYKFGELILLVLAIVLVVSCVLIITQKIVDYKKRLY